MIQNIIAMEQDNANPITLHEVQECTPLGNLLEQTSWDFFSNTIKETVLNKKNNNIPRALLEIQPIAKSYDLTAIKSAKDFRKAIAGLHNLANNNELFKKEFNGGRPENHLEFIEKLIYTLTDQFQQETYNDSLLTAACLKTHGSYLWIQKHTLKHPYPWTALLTAIAQEKVELAEKILQLSQYSHPYLDLTTPCGNNALLCASSHGLLHIVQLILTHSNVSINAQNNNGDNALLVAETNGHLPVIEYLLSKGVNKNACNHSGASFSSRVSFAQEEKQRQTQGFKEGYDHLYQNSNQSFDRPEFYYEDNFRSFSPYVSNLRNF
jgi:hypothetical protein